MLWRCGNPGQTFICIFACFTLDKYLHICLFMITNISVFAACDKYVYTIHICSYLIADIYISISMGTFGHRKYKSRGEDGNK